jgi:hypothetical protein
MGRLVLLLKSERRGIRWIAELANVSIGTVDRALHGRNGIKESTRHRILQIARLPLTPLFGYFWLPMNQPVHPLWTGGKPLVVGPVPVPIQEVMLSTQKFS